MTVSVSDATASRRMKRRRCLQWLDSSRYDDRAESAVTSCRPTLSDRLAHDEILL